MSDVWLWMTAAELGRGMETGAIDARALTETYLGAIEAHPDADRIYAHPTSRRARAEADASRARARAGLRRGPLDGVPLSWKDLFDVVGAPTEGGSGLLQGRTPERDAEVTARAARAGLVSLGKTHMTELAFSGIGINPATATPPNINDPELAPGGSSSGAAASVAFGLAAAAVGSDTGGSIRVPAAWNDLVGMKPSHGGLPMEGVLPLCPRFDTIGPIARSVEDAALLLAVLSASPVPDLEGSRLEGTRLLALETEAAAPETTEAFDAALPRLAAAGARIERAAVPAARAALALSPIVFAAEAYGVWGETIEANADVMFPPVRERFRSGAGYSAAEFVRAWGRLDALRAEWRAATAAYDAVLLPTAANLPPNVERLLADHAVFNAENLLTLRNTRVANLMGLCALSLPTGVPCCGLMAAAPAGAENRLLRLGAAMEAALG